VEVGEELEMWSGWVGGVALVDVCCRDGRSVDLEDVAHCLLLGGGETIRL